MISHLLSGGLIVAVLQIHLVMRYGILIRHGDDSFFSLPALYLYFVSSQPWKTLSFTSMIIPCTLSVKGTWGIGESLLAANYMLFVCFFLMPFCVSQLN